MITAAKKQTVNIQGDLLDAFDVLREKGLKMKKEMEIIANSNLYKKLCLEMDRDYWLKGESKSSKLKHLSNRQIYLLLMAAAEEWNGLTDYERDLWIVRWYSLSKTIGYMNPGKKEIYINKRFYINYTTEKCGSNGEHEWRHTMGARHSGTYFRQSLAYFGNEVYEKCYDHLIRKGLPDIADPDTGEVPGPIELPVEVKPEIEQPTYKRYCYKPKYYYLVPWLWNKVKCVNVRMD